MIEADKDFQFKIFQKNYFMFYLKVKNKILIDGVFPQIICKTWHYWCIFIKRWKVKKVQVTIIKDNELTQLFKCSFSRAI